MTSSSIFLSSSVFNDGSIFDNIKPYVKYVDEELPYSTYKFFMEQLGVLLNQYETQSESLVIEAGMNIDLLQLNELRENQNYEKDFINLINSMTMKGKKRFIYELSQISNSFILGCEEEFIIDILRNGNLELQNLALSALSNWDNKSLINKISDIQLENVYLQNELDELVGKNT